MARLAIRQLTYSGDKYVFSSPVLSDGVIVVEGENGTGKSTFSDLIYFCLGGNVPKFRKSSSAKHIEITSDTNNFVELHIQIDESNFKLKRYFESNDIAVFSETEVLGVFPVIRSKTSKHIFSDWILDQLGIGRFTLYFSRFKGQINFSDLLRLIYHDQAQDPDKIFKKQDTTSFISDSGTFRKAIFEVLVGRSFTEYYKALDELNSIERERTEIKGAIDAFTSTVDKFGRTEDWNTIRIQEELVQIEAQMNKLNISRESLRQSNSTGNTLAVLPNLKIELENLQTEQPSLLDELNAIYGEMNNLQSLKRSLIIEVTQIKKIIFTHEQLKLFSPDTCPYCLSAVERSHQKCICGNTVDEAEYERFFYSSEEYLNILKSKQKNVDTVETLIDACQERASEIKTQISDLKDEYKNIQARISAAVVEKTSSIDFSKLNEIDDKILELRTKKESLKNQLKVETTRQEMEDRLSRLEATYRSKPAEVDKLEAISREQMIDTLQDFNDRYNKLMMETVSNCRRAKLDDSYMPIINEGDYVELSALVPKRLMYFLTLLHLSVKNDGMNFPKFLLIDTPDTAGIDDDNLKKAISKIPEVIDGNSASSCQAILTTGINMYPESLKGNVVLSLTKKDRLLKETSAGDSQN